jgi:transcriptional regulator with XRE-family HTH domain
MEKITQREIARRVGLAEESLSRVIHGKREISKKMKTRLAFELSRRVDELFPPGGAA